MIGRFLVLLFAFAAPLSPVNAQPVADPAAAPVVTNDIGAFPFIQAPAGYVARGAKTLELEEKYLFPGGKVRVVEGRYYHADIYNDGEEWNETQLLRGLDGQVTALGGVRVFDGSMPAGARKMIDENSPRFVADLYDPWPYRFRQYLIRAPERRVWIEIGYRYNANMIDLTVVVEDAAE